MMKEKRPDKGWGKMAMLGSPSRTRPYLSEAIVTVRDFISVSENTLPTNLYTPNEMVLPLVYMAEIEEPRLWMGVNGGKGEGAGNRYRPLRNWRWGKVGLFRCWNLLFLDVGDGSFFGDVGRVLKVLQEVLHPDFWRYFKSQWMKWWRYQKISSRHHQSSEED